MLSPSQRRLQREADFTGARLSSFSDVFLRHGLPGALLCIACMLYPQTRSLLIAGAASADSQPMLYVTWGIGLLIALNGYAWYIDRHWNVSRLAWVIYLAAVSTWEESVFRLALPYYAASQGIELATAVIASNLVFAVLHYFTLRWKWQWCVLVFFFGISLSRNMDNHFDLLLVIGIHWVATFINTPRSPGQSRERPRH